MLGSLDGLYSTKLAYEKLLQEPQMQPPKTIGLLAIALLSIPPAVYKQLYPEADYDFELKSGEFVWVFNGRPNLYTGRTIRGEMGELACWWVALIRIDVEGQPIRSPLTPRWTSHPRADNDAYQEFRRQELNARSWVNPLVLDVRAGPVHPGCIAGRRVLKDMGEARRTYFIDQ